jgi:hypothetical protein
MYVGKSDFFPCFYLQHCQFTNSFIFLVTVSGVTVSIVDNILTTSGKKFSFSFLLVEMDTDPDPYAFDAYPDPDPAK